jgi:hypothetical protein
MNIEPAVCTKDTTKSYQTLGGVAPFSLEPFTKMPILARQLWGYDAMTYLEGFGKRISPTLVYQGLDSECSDLRCFRWFYLQHPRATVERLQNITGNDALSGAVTLRQAPIYEFVFSDVKTADEPKTRWTYATYEGVRGHKLRIYAKKDNIENGDSVLFSIALQLNVLTKIRNVYV